VLHIPSEEDRIVSKPVVSTQERRKKFPETLLRMTFKI